MPKAKTTTKTRAKKGDTEVVAIPALQLKVLKLKLKGITPLIVHKFSEKQRKQMQRKQAGEAQNKKSPKKPVEEFKASMYIIPGTKGKHGFPASGFKKAAISACRYVEGLKMTAAKGSFHVLGDLVEIKSKKPVMRTDTVRVGTFGKKVADIRYRPEYQKWSCTLDIRYNASVITPAQIAHLFNVAGFAVGVGDWRPEKDGQFGMFEVAKG